MAPSGSAPLLVASNRGPLSFTEQDDGTLQVSRGGGGLVSGLSGLGSDDVVWVCAALTDGDRQAARAVPDGRLDRDGHDTGGMAVRMLDIDPATFHRAYNAIANSTLWFVHHLLYAIPTRSTRRSDASGPPTRPTTERSLMRWPRRRARAPRCSCRTTTSRCSRGC